MSENEDKRHEVTEEPATHKKKAQAFLFALLGILVVVMIVDVIRKSGGSDENETPPSVAAIATSPVQIRSFDERVEEAKRVQAHQAQTAEIKATPADIVKQVQQSRENEKEQRVSGWGSTQQEKTPAEIYLQAEQMRVLESRRSRLKVELTNNRGGVIPVASAAPTGGTYPRGQGLSAERTFIQDELARVRAIQEKLLNGETPSASGGSFTPQQHVTAQNAADYQVGQPVIEQGQPKPGQVLLATGTVISAALDQMTMSDVTGAFRAIITRDVYDPSQRFVLLPKGAKLVGKAIRLKAVNEPIQNRMVLAMNWCVLPNGKRISFNKTVSMDSAGVAALKDQVNYHLIPQVLGVAAYALLSSETSRSGSGDNTDSTYEGDVGTAMREQFAPMVSKFLNLVPTVTLRPGTPMRVFIEDDLFITPWDRVYSRVIPSA
jgi:type IV secretory pathway VirB10-like protein